MWGDVRRPTRLPKAVPSRNLAPAWPFPVLLKWQKRTRCQRGAAEEEWPELVSFGELGPWRQSKLFSGSQCTKAWCFLSCFTKTAFSQWRGSGRLPRCLSSPKAAASSSLLPSGRRARGAWARVRTSRFLLLSLAASIFSRPSKNLGEAVCSSPSGRTELRRKQWWRRWWPWGSRHSRPTPRKFTLAGDPEASLLARCVLAPEADDQLGSC